MTDRIGSVAGSLPLSVPSPQAPAAAGAGEAFSSVLGRVLETVDTTAAEANLAVEKMVTGEGDVHQAMLAMQRAEETLQITVQVRNKLVQAYQDIMRMPV